MCMDADKAYDRVQIHFLKQIMETMGFPRHALRIVDMMYKGVHGMSRAGRWLKGSGK